MIKTVKGAMKLIGDGGYISRRWGGFRLVDIDGKKHSILPKLVTELESLGKIKRSDDGTTRMGEEWTRVLILGVND